MTVNFAHCFFEQSGVFRDEFRKLNIPAMDYDIANEFGTTDFVMDLLAQIDYADRGRLGIKSDLTQPTLFDS